MILNYLPEHSQQVKKIKVDSTFPTMTSVVATLIQHNLEVGSMLPFSCYVNTLGHRKNVPTLQGLTWYFSKTCTKGGLNTRDRQPIKDNDKFPGEANRITLFFSYRFFSNVSDQRSNTLPLGHRVSK